MVSPGKPEKKHKKNGADDKPRWKLALQARDEAIFVNGQGDSARVPVYIARTIAAKKPLDLDVVDLGDGIVGFAIRRDIDMDQVVAQLPRTLLAQLPTILKGWKPKETGR